MIELVLWCLPILGIIASFIYMAIRAWFDFPNRTADDVVEFLQHVDLNAFSSLLNPMEEASLRAAMDRRNFRHVQRKRIYLCMEYVKRMAHNADVLLELGNNQARSSSDSLVVQSAHLLQEKGVQVKIYSLLALSVLRFRLLVRVDSWFLFGYLSLCDLREVWGIRGLDRYDELKTAASHLFLLIGSKKFEALLEVL